MKILPIQKFFLYITFISGSLMLSSFPVNATVADGVFAYEKGDYQKAREEWLPYAALGNPNALYNLGQLSRMGRGVEKNYAKAESYYLRAAEKGHVGAQRNLGTLYYFGRINNNPDFKKAFDWLKKAAVNGDNRAQLMIGTMYFNGEATEKNDIHAYAWVFLASQSGSNKASSTLNKLNDSLSQDAISQAKEMAPQLISRQLSPDDVGLMVKQPEPSITTEAVLNPVATEENQETLERTKPNKEHTDSMAVTDAVVDKKPPLEENQYKDALDTQDNFRIQLGSFSTEEAAQKSLAQIEKDLSYLLDNKFGTIERADLGEKGIFYRLQLKSFNIKYDAENMCEQLKENGQSCYVIKAP